MGRILIVDDDPNTRHVLASALRLDHHQTWEAGGVGEARRSLSANDFDVVMTDQKMQDGEGLAVLASAHENDPTTCVILLGIAPVEVALESMSQGVFDFLTKPFQLEAVRASVRRACEHSQLLRENTLLKDVAARLEGTSEIYGESPAIRRVLEHIARVAAGLSPVLITGEVGTGKELVARAIHRSGPRSAKPFVAVNCVAFTDIQLENELFGHDKGAFIGADHSHHGLVEAAHEGTLFVEAVGEMSLAAQARLLRVLTDGQVSRVGSRRLRRVDVRVLAATHSNLEQEVKDGRFREDLFYRLAFDPIHVPALRERRDDITGLSEVYCRQVANELKVPCRRLSADAVELLRHHSFTGNLRGLKNLIERAYLHTDHQEIQANDLAQQEAENAGVNGNRSKELAIAVAGSFDLTDVLERIEKELIVRTLHATDGAQAEAARRMGLSRSALAYKLTKYGIRSTESGIKRRPQRGRPVEA